MLRTFGGILAVTAILFCAGCARTQPVFDVIQAPVAANKANPSADDVRQAIVRAGSGLGWQMSPDRPGHVTGRLLMRSHVAVVDIDYAPKTYSIKYRESTNLNFEAGTIHRNYNVWIQDLDRAIKAQLQLL
jgi:hypothetical protein